MKVINPARVTISGKATADAIENGVGEAFHYWVSLHDVTTGDCIEGGIKQAFSKWLDANRNEIIERIAEMAGKGLKP